ncbi:MAG: hypothetical protein SGPRY_002717 [Prymnesium sp.]
MWALIAIPVRVHALICTVFISMASGACYRDAPLLLNLEVGEEGRWESASTWCNLGLWPSPSFKQACEALATKLGEAVGLSRGDVVLDCGVGYGDQCELWLSGFGVSRIVALEFSSHLADAARRRLLPLEAIAVHTCSATAIPSEVASAAAGCDAVVCLDCAYHFDTRETFLKQAGSLVRAGGVYGAIDILPTDVGWGIRLLAQAAIAAACNIPRANLYGMREYREALSGGGLELTRFESLSGRVFEPFAEHAAQQRKQLAKQLSWSEWAFLHAISAIMGVIGRYRLFDAVLVTAKKL